MSKPIESISNAMMSTFSGKCYEEYSLCVSMLLTPPRVYVDNIEMGYDVASLHKHITDMSLNLGKEMSAR